MTGSPERHPVALALVHHANQYLITDGYDNRQGIGEITDGYAAVLRLHERYEIPAGLHLSGTLLEALAWHRPDFLELVRHLLGTRLLSLVGGCYAENIMTLFPPGFNRRQLDEFLRVCENLLDCPPERVKTFWPPERVWDTGLLASVLASPSLSNGGYRHVLLDDRLLFPADGFGDGSRASFDATGPYGSIVRPAPREACRTYRIVGGRGLTVVPISANLRYWVPPRGPEHWELVEEAVETLAGGGEDSLLVYADDLEKAAGVGGWAPALEQFEAFLRWLPSQGERLRPVSLDTWLEEKPPREERRIEAGAFYELSRSWKAGEDYRGWWEDSAWSTSKRHLSTAHEAVQRAEWEAGDGSLVDLARKHLLASAHETAWHEPGEDGQTPYPAPWAKALASHARACVPIVNAAGSFTRSEERRRARVEDVDVDGEDEVVLANGELYAVLAPRHGGRLVYLFARTPQGGELLIGNPTDHWNFQEALNRYMDCPPNHPAALADVGFEHDRYEVAALESSSTHAQVELENVNGSSPLCGARKSLCLAADASALVVCYRLPEGVAGLATEACLSPDYLALLREGRRALRPYEGEEWRGFRNGDACAWLALDPTEATEWAQPGHAAAGHGLNTRVNAEVDHFHLLIGCGDTDAEQCEKMFGDGKQALHEREVSIVTGAQLAEARVDED
jgi:starch synthase